MSQIITVKLARPDATAWGFRLQGGKDFGTALVIQKVNGGSPAEKAGLIAGDSVIKVNNIDVYNLRHKDAQDVIVKAGQAFEMTVQRGGSTWKPSVSPVGSLPRSQPVANSVSPVTKTSLAAKKQDYTPIGTAHNLSPKGYSTSHINGSADGPRLVNKQYNSPLALYSEASIAETLSAQAEVLSTGALGVNFKKNEKNYNAANSEVYKMLQETEKEPKTPEPALDVMTASAVSPVSTGLRHVQAPETKPAPSTPQLPPGQNICADCERLIVGVFVRIKDKNLHVECFKCATCGSSLKNVGYYNINNKLYCDIHAKLAAKSCAPAPNMVPITIPPGGKAPAGAISAALASQSVPSPSPLSPSGNLPPPFQCLENNVLSKDPVATLTSALTAARIKEYKEFGTNTEPAFLNEKLESSVPFNKEVALALTDNNDSNAQVHFIPYSTKTGVSLSGPKPFSSVQPSTPTHAPVSAPLSSTLPKSASSTVMPGRFSAVKSPPSAREHVNEEITSNTSNRNNEENEILMTPVSSEVYIPVSDYTSGHKFNSIDLRVPIHVVQDKINSPDQEVFQINASRSIDNSPVKFDGNLKNFIASQLDNKNPMNFLKKDSKEIMFGQLNTDNIDTNINDVSHIKNEQNGIWPANLNKLGNVSVEYPACVDCNKEIRRGPFITALGKIWCPEHFVCTTPSCRRPLQDMGFVEERGQLYCEFCFEQYLAPTCSKCNTKIKGDCLNAIGKHFHPECFACAYCSKLFGNSPFFLEDGLPYCEADWNELFTTKCFACGFPVEAGDRWVEALNNNYHSQCFNCTMCKKNLEGQSFYAKGGRPFCKNHAR